MAVAVVVALALLSLTIGAAHTSIADMWRDPFSHEILTISRVPRTAAVLLAGSAMAVSGLVMQHLTRNRFVSPSTAGTVDAAALGALFTLLVMAGAPVMVKIIVATGFALAGTGIFLVIIHRVRLRDVVFVPLVGLVLGGIYRAIAEFVALRENLSQSLQVWLNGDFSGVILGRYETLWFAGGAALLVYLFARRFTAAGLGRDTAISLGINYRAVMAGGLSLAALTTAVVVVTVGAIPFLGLVVPNVVTMTLGDNLRKVLPATALAGAGVTLACDILGRIVIFPYEIPVGSIAGVLGAGVFAALVLRKGARYGSA